LTVDVWMSAVRCGRVAGTVFLPSSFEFSVCSFESVECLDLFELDLKFGCGFRYDGLNKFGGVFAG